MGIEISIGTDDQLLERLSGQLYIRDHAGKTIVGFICFSDLGVAIAYHRQVAGDRAELDETTIGTADLANTVPQIVPGEVSFQNFKGAFVAFARLE